jgi:hypothetical protein
LAASNLRDHLAVIGQADAVEDVPTDAIDHASTGAMVKVD